MSIRQEYKSCAAHLRIALPGGTVAVYRCRDEGEETASTSSPLRRPRRRRARRGRARSWPRPPRALPHQRRQALRVGGARQVAPAPAPVRPRGRGWKPWVLAEIDRVRPTVLVALGATAALVGRTVSSTRHRTRPIPGPLARTCLVTYHRRRSSAPSPARRFSATRSDLS
jgi:hypothetical protein